MSATRWIHSEILAMIMDRRGITGRTLAQRTGVHEVAISYLRSGTRRTLPEDSALKIAQVLGVHVDVFSSRASRGMIVDEAAS